MTGMTIAAVHGPDDVRLDPAPIPEPGPGEAVVAVKVCGICGTDLGFAHEGGMPFGNEGPLPLGHEFSGVIAAIGEGVTTLAPGMRVTVNPTTPDNYHGAGGPGAFASHILIRNAEAPGTVFALPDDIDFATGALVEPLSVALHAVNRSGFTAGQSAVVFGAGPIGLGVVAMLAAHGASDIVCVDKVEQRLARARSMGAHATFNPDSDDIWAEIATRHGTGDLYGMPVIETDHYFDAAGAAPVLQAIVANARFAAGITVVAVHHAPVALDLTMMLSKELSLVTSMAYPNEFPAVIDLLAKARIDTESFVSHTYPFERFTEAFAMAARADQAAKVLVTF